VINGSVIDDLGFNHGPGAMRDGAGAPNTVVARLAAAVPAQRLRFTADEHDKATFGNSSRVVLARGRRSARRDRLGAVRATFGHPAGTDAVTVARMNSGAMVGSVFGSTPGQIVPYLADGLARVTGWDPHARVWIGAGSLQPGAGAHRPCSPACSGAPAGARRRSQQALYRARGGFLRGGSRS
jgi:hypothetical protein